MLRSDITAILNGFDSRMKFINIVRAMLDYPMKDSIQEMFPDRDVLDNIILMVLVFIKERTLGGEQECRISDIGNFLEQISPILPGDCRIDPAELAKFIMTYVLRNNGIPMEYSSYDPTEENFRMQPIRLIQEQKGCYHLTDDAFDFLFRSMEIESELDYSVTRFRMQEYMKRDNYAQALEQSRELVSRIRNLKISMDDFLLRWREQLSSVAEDDYDAMITRIREVLDGEEQELTDIQKNAALRAEKLDEALQNGIDADTARKHRAALEEIMKNIDLTIEEQRGLINKRYRFSDEVSNILQDNFVFRQFERLNFKEDILTPLQYMENGLADAARFLLFPLVKPSLAPQFGIENFYYIDMRSQDENSDAGISVDTDGDDPYEKLIAERNARFTEIIRLLFGYIRRAGGSFSVSSFVSELSEECLFDLCTDNALPNVLLTLYEIGEIDIAGRKESPDPVPEPMGEFEPAWCLGELDSQLTDMKALHFTKQNKKFSFSAEQNGLIHKIEMTDIRVEVIR